jgi:hypothetical protein
MHPLSVFVLKNLKIKFMISNKNGLVIFIFIACSSFLKSQSLDSCGIDNNPKVNLKEGTFLNYFLEKNRKDYDFRNKKTAFIGGNGGGRIIPKKEFFDTLKRYEKIDTSIFNGSFIVLLTEKEKIKSGGYDVLITYWAKGIFNRKRLLKNLSKLKTD